MLLLILMTIFNVICAIWNIFFEPKFPVMGLINAFAAGACFMCLIYEYRNKSL